MAADTLYPEGDYQARVDHADVAVCGWTHVVRGDGRYCGRLVANS